MNAPPHIEQQARQQGFAMDRMYRHQRHIYDASRRFYLLGRDRMIREMRVPPGGTVLECGCGTGRNLIRTAEIFPGAKLHGFDISAEMLKSATSAIARTGLSERIRLAEGDAVTFDPGRAFGVKGFDRVFMSYTLSMIPRWEIALQQAFAAVRPGGSLHVVDFGQCESLPRAFGSALHLWLRQFHVTPRATLVAAARSISDANGAALAVGTGHGGYHWHVTITRAGPAPKE